MQLNKELNDSIVENFNPKKPLETAVLFLIFNRLGTTKKVFEAIRLAKPPRLYIAADGARITKQGEAEKVKSVRDYVLKNIDWKCEVKTLLRDKNLGCKHAVSSALSWFFQNEEMGIILEDDCLPNNSFFWYCENLLKLYKDDLRIWHIGGVNFQDNIIRGDGDYYFSKYNHIWGWASWANRWKFYDVEINDIKDSGFINNTFSNKSAITYWHKIYKKVKTNKVDTWDYQWTFTIWNNKGISILPKFDLVSNIGFGEGATHTSGSINLTRENYSLVVRKHPEKILVNIKADNYTFDNLFKKGPLLIRIFKLIKFFINTNIKAKF